MSVGWGLDENYHFVLIPTNSNLVKSVWMSEAYPHQGTLLYIVCCNESYANKPYFRAHGAWKSKCGTSYSGTLLAIKRNKLILVHNLDLKGNYAG